MKAVLILAGIGALVVVVIVVVLIAHYTTRPKEVEDPAVRALAHEAAGIFRHLLVPISLDAMVLLDDHTKATITDWLTDYNKETADK